MSENMLFCLGDDKFKSKGEGYQKSYRVFNKQVSESEYEEIKESLPEINIPQTHWIKESDMTGEEKKNKPLYKTLGGYLKTITYEESWANWWNKASKSDKNAILDLDQFDADIFKGITGIDLKKDTKSDKKRQELIDKSEELKEKANELIEQANKL